MKGFACIGGIMALLLMAGCGVRPGPRIVNKTHSVPWPQVDGMRWGLVLDSPNDRNFSDRALERERIGLFPGAEFRLVTGSCPDCSMPEALWYFRDEIVAVPRSNEALAGANHPEAPHVLSPPPVIWVGAPELIEGAVLTPDGRSLKHRGESRPLAVTPRLPTNRSFADQSTVRFFQQRPVSVRGVTRELDGVKSFVARTIWPEDTRINPDQLVWQPLREGESLAKLVMAQTGGVGGVFSTRLLWERAPGRPRNWSARPVLAFMLNGAQGDDDGAHAGHLALATGIFGPRGEWRDWLVTNFYPMRDKSEKGIIPAMLPMDKYLTDLNSGQAYFRPSYMLVAVLRDDRIPRRVQAALQDVLYRYYCLDIEYHHAARNSTALLVDPLRELGWQIPRAGATSYVGAFAAFPIAALVQLSLADGRSAFSFLATERTRLMPRQAFQAIGERLLDLGAAPDGQPGDRTPFENTMAADLDALLFVQIPQIPSSRAFGTHPVDSLAEYGLRYLAHRREWQTAHDGGKRSLPPEELLRACKPGK